MINPISASIIIGIDSMIYPFFPAAINFDMHVAVMY